LQESDKSGQPPQESRPLGVAGWIAIVILAGFLAGGVYYAVHTWNAMAGTPIPPLGWLFMSLGAFFTLLVGGGLMALLFYSSRKGKDF
jgi:ABC-type multidrug transport system permease subunit